MLGWIFWRPSFMHCVSIAYIQKQYEQFYMFSLSYQLWNSCDWLAVSLRLHFVTMRSRNNEIFNSRPVLDLSKWMVQGRF
jgi:hypothetical protein